MKGESVSTMQMDTLFSQGMIALTQYSTLCALSMCAGSQVL